MEQVTIGLVSAPQCFTKVRVALAAHLRVILVRLQCYLDDILIQALSPSRAAEDVCRTIQILEAHDFFV